MPPTMLLNSLEGVRKRVKVLGVVYGVGIVLAAAVGLLLATVGIDYLMNLYPVPRVMIALAALAGVLYVLVRWVIKPLVARLSVSDVAGRLEQAFPQFNDRLRSTLDFMKSDVPGSETMKQRVVGEAAELAGRLDLGSAIVATPAWYSLAGGLAAILLAAMLALLTPNYASIAMTRLLSPFNGQAWPKRVEIQLASDVPTRVPVGQRVEVKMKLARGDSSSRKATIIYKYDNGAEQRELMLRGPDGTYTASIDARVDSGKAASNLSIWMQSGDDEKHLVPITVVPRLAIRSVEAELTPPPYVTTQKVTSINLVATPAIVADGSKVAVKINFTKPLAEGSMVQLVPASQEMAQPEVQWQNDSSMIVVANWTARKSLRFHIKATDVDGFSNNALEEYEIIVRPDQMPSVQIETPRRNEERTIDSVVPLVGLAEDDYGIASLKLVVDRVSGGEKGHWEIPLLQNNEPIEPATAARAEGITDRLRLRVSYQWALSQLKDANLKSNDVLEYFLVIKDNFALDGQTHAESPSGRLRITIITKEDLLTRVIDDLRQIKAQIQNVKSGVDRTRAETGDLANDTRNRDQIDAADRAALDRLTNQQATSTSQTRQIASRVNTLQQRLAENGIGTQELNDIARDVAADLERAAENPMREATNQLGNANRQNTNSQQRNPAGANQQPNNNDQQGQQQAEASQQQQNQQNANASAANQQQQRPGQPNASANANRQQQQGNNQGQQNQDNAQQQQANAGQQQNGEQQQGQQANADQQNQQNGQQQGQQQAGERSQQANANGQRSNQQNQNGQQQGEQQANAGQQQDQQGQQNQAGEQQANAGQQQQGQQGQQQAGQRGQQQANANGQRSGQQNQNAQQGQQQANAGQQQQGQQGQQQSGQQGQQQNGQQGQQQPGQRSQQANASGQRSQQSGQRSGNQQSGQQQSGQQQSGQQQSGQQQSGQQQSGQQQSGQQQSGQQQAGNQQQGQQSQQAQQQQSAPDQQQRNEALARAMQNQQQASEELQRAMDRMSSIGSLQETLSKLRELLQQQQQVTRDTRQVGQQNIGRTPEQMNQQDRERLNQIAEQQARLAEQTNQAMQQMQQQAQQMRQSDPTASQAMQRAQQSGQQQQTSQNQQRASSEVRNNQQAQAQQAQRQAELGLQSMVDQLREAEQHRLADLQKRLEEMQAQIANLIRRQAGHNLDNLVAQGPEKVAGLDEPIRNDLLLKAERVMENLGAAQTPAQLSTAQEQTERNTRDLGKVAAEMPSGAESASHLTRAASRMERAIVNLRDKKLTDAYDPSQIEALTELDAAIKTVDQQREQIDQQVDDQRKEALRQRYVKVKAEQQKLNDETARIDKTRGADGALGRAETVRLGQLPGEQGKLVDEITAIGEDLAAGESSVYTWANKDIAESMTEVKDDLGKQKTDLATRSEQTRIGEQLDAMIRNLAVRPRDSRFAQDAQERDQQQQDQQRQPGQRQQQQRPPRLPAEAELRLLQDLQRAVNKNTVVINDQPEKDKPKLLTLGTRQGDLRGVLDQMLQKASQGKIKLGPEPDNKDQLPEEAKAEQVENQELEQDLLKGAPDAEKSEQQANLIGDRMARSRQRLAMNNDPGAITQTIQKRIIDDIDGLIQQARQQQAQTRNSQQRQRQQQQQQQQQQQAQRMQQARANQQQNQQQQGQQQQDNPNSQSARESRAPGQSEVKTDLSKEIANSAAEWGTISPRLRDAAIDGASEQPIEQYRKMTEDYTRSISAKGAGAGQ